MTLAGLKSDANGNKLDTSRFGGKPFTKSAGTKDHGVAGTINSRVGEDAGRAATPDSPPAKSCRQREVADGAGPQRPGAA